MEAPLSAAWSPSWTSNLIKFIILSVLFIVALVLLFTMGNLNEIRKNFPRYRCNPLFIPFASQFGYDTKENFSFCLSTIFDIKAAEIFGPIYRLLAVFVSLTKMIVDVALGIRKLFSNFLLGVNRFVQNVRDRIQQVMFSIRMSFLRIQHLMGRVYGTMYAVIWMGTSAITAGFNISDNSLVKFLFEFCFDPDTPLKLADGSFVPIKDAKIGMKLAGTPTNPTPVITSVFEFDGSRTPMVQIGDVVISKEHYVSFGPNKIWASADTHPAAVVVNTVPKLICLNVTGHEFIVGRTELVVADYDEHSSPEVISKTQQMAESHLNGGGGSSSDKTLRTNYDLGLDPNTEVLLNDGTWKRLSNIQLGDSVWNSGQVYGIVHESVSNIVTYKSICMSSAQLVYNETKQKWTRNLETFTNLETPRIFIQLLTANMSAMRIRNPDVGHEVFVRDYREIPIPEMESAYVETFHTSEKLSVTSELQTVC
jgi:hypothetical protein